jgi:hypothetical protein
MRVCNTQAGNPIRVSTVKPLAVTGVYAVSCRHVLMQPGGVIDFKKGERCVESPRFGNTESQIVCSSKIRICGRRSWRCCATYHQREASEARILLRQQLQI